MSTTDSTFLVQCHWQNRNNLRQTEFIAQGEFADGRAAFDWAEETFRKHAESCPDTEAWVPLVCTQDCEYFMLAANPPAVT